MFKSPYGRQCRNCPSPSHQSFIIDPAQRHGPPTNERPIFFFSRKQHQKKTWAHRAIPRGNPASRAFWIQRLRASRRSTPDRQGRPPSGGTRTWSHYTTRVKAPTNPSANHTITPAFLQTTYQRHAGTESKTELKRAFKPGRNNNLRRIHCAISPHPSRHDYRNRLSGVNSGKPVHRLFWGIGHRHLLTPLGSRLNVHIP